MKESEIIRRMRREKIRQALGPMLARMFGRTVRIEKLGDNCPKKTGFQGLYIPLPEYEISLWCDEPLPKQ